MGGLVAPRLGHDGGVKRFRFRYDALLLVRERREEEAREGLRRLEQGRDEAQAGADRLSADLSQRRQAFAEAAGPGRLDLEALGFAQQFITGLEHALTEQLQTLATWELRVGQQREHLAGLAREAEAIRRLKAKHLAAWVAELEGQEARFLDELATLRHAHRRLRPGGP